MFYLFANVKEFSSFDFRYSDFINLDKTSCNKKQIAVL